MARRIFISYKHNDRNVKPLGKQNEKSIARDYVDSLMNAFKRTSNSNKIYKGEQNEDLSKFTKETIERKLKEKMHDSSITIVLISPNMKQQQKEDREQWIPWEISYSLKEIDRIPKKNAHNTNTRKPKKKLSSAILAVVLPDKEGNYSYYIKKFKNCDCRTLKTKRLFQILQSNMFNHKSLETEYCDQCKLEYSVGEPSYIKSVQWDEFIQDMDSYIELAEEIQKDRKAYKIQQDI